MNKIKLSTGRLSYISSWLLVFIKLKFLMFPQQKQAPLQLAVL